MSSLIYLLEKYSFIAMLFFKNLLPFMLILLTIFLLVLTLQLKIIPFFCLMILQLTTYPVPSPTTAPISNPSSSEPIVTAAPLPPHIPNSNQNQTIENTNLKRSYRTTKAPRYLKDFHC